MEEREYKEEEFTMMDQIQWYLDRLNDMQLKKVFRYVFRLFVGKE